MPTDYTNQVTPDNEFFLLRGIPLLLITIVTFVVVCVLAAQSSHHARENERLRADVKAIDEKLTRHIREQVEQSCEIVDLSVPPYPMVIPEVQSQMIRERVVALIEQEGGLEGGYELFNSGLYYFNGRWRIVLIDTDVGFGACCPLPEYTFADSGSTDKQLALAAITFSRECHNRDQEMEIRRKAVRKELEGSDKR